MRTKLLRVIGKIIPALAAAMLAAGEAWAAPIVQDQISGYISILSYAPVGQTFTAEDPYISSIGFSVDNWTHLYRVGYTLQYSLYEGLGVSGVLLGSSSVLLNEGFSGYADADFSFAHLAVGGIYTCTITAPDYDWGVAYNNPTFTSGDPIPGKIDYLGGQAFASGNLQPHADLTFRIEPIPEPSAPALFVLALGLHQCRRRRRTHFLTQQKCSEPATIILSPVGRKSAPGR